MRLFGELEVDGLAEELGLDGDPDQGPLELPHVAAHGLRQEERDLTLKPDPLALGLLLQNRNACVELGHLDVRNHPGLEAADQAFLHLRNLLRVDVRSNDDLLVGMVERVEGVEELFLRLLATCQELDVVHEQHVALVAVALAESG